MATNPDTQKMTPQQARTLEQAARLQTDNKDCAEGWILLNSDGNVVLSKQRNGETQTGKVSFSRRAFDAFVRWYLKPQKVSPERNKGAK